MAEEDDREVKRRLEIIENAVKELTPKKTGAQMKAKPWDLSRFIWYMVVIYSIVFGVIYILTKS